MMIAGLTLEQIVVYLTAGALGGFIKQLIDNGGVLILPTIEDHKLNLGFIANMLIGAFVGIIADNHPLTSLLGGYAGAQIIEKSFGKLKKTSQGKLDIWGGKFTK